MEQALAVDLVLESVLQHLPYNDLKNVRQVNKFWNKMAILELRKRSANICLHSNNYQSYCQLESSMENKGIMAEIPVDVNLHFFGKSFYSWSILTDILVNQNWRSRIVSVELECSTTGTVNRLLKFVLQQLSSLKSLTFYEVENSDTDCLPEDLKRELVQATTETVCPLQFLYLDFSGHIVNSGAVSYDPNFLLQCKSLRDFHAEIYDSPETFVRFLERWELLLKQHSKLSHFNQLKFTVNVEKDDEEIQPFRDAMSKFISLNQPTSLKFSGEFDFRYQTLLPTIKSPIESFTAAVPINEQKNYCCGWLLLVLRKCAAFAKLKKLCLILHWKNVEHESADEALLNCNNHNLSAVSSLSIEAANGHGPLFTYVLKDSAQFLQKITHLSLSGLRPHGFNAIGLAWAELVWEDVFDGIKEFPHLRELSLEVKVNGVYVLSRIRDIYVKKVKGFFSQISDLSGLRKFSASLDGPCFDLSPSDSFDMVLVGFFSGTAKCASDLRLILDVKFSEKADYRIYRSFTKDQFERELVKAYIRSATLSESSI